jgi:hypothetical protein
MKEQNPRAIVFWWLVVFWLTVAIILWWIFL